MKTMGHYVVRLVLEMKHVLIVREEREAENLR